MITKADVVEKAMQCGLVQECLYCCLSGKISRMSKGGDYGV